MKHVRKAFAIFLTLAVTISLNSNKSHAQWIQGVFVDDTLSSVGGFGGGCYPNPDFTFSFDGSHVTGVTVIAIVQDVPANSAVMNTGDTINIGDTLLLAPGYPNYFEVYFFSGYGVASFLFKAFGMPQVAGESYPCNYPPAWISNLLLCPEGLFTNSDICIVGAPTGLPESSFPNGILFPTSENNYSLLILSSRNAEQLAIHDMQGREWLCSETQINPFQLNLSHLTSGIYVLSLYNNSPKPEHYQFQVIK